MKFTWLILAILAPLAWSFANYLDKFILAKSVSNDGEDGGGGGLLILSGLVSLLFAGTVAVIKGFNSMFILSERDIVFLIISGVFEAMYLLFYFRALEKENATTVVGLFQFSPIFGLLFGFLFLREIPNIYQACAVVLIFIGTLFILWKKGDKFSLRGGIVGLMFLSTLFVGLYNTLFKIAGENISFWTAIYWQYFGIGLAGILFFIFIKSYRTQFDNMIKKRAGIVLFATFAAEVMNILAILATNAAILLAPIGIVLSVGSVQPIFVLLEGMALAYIAPKIIGENERPVLNPRYIIGIVLVCIGGFLVTWYN